MMKNIVLAVLLFIGFVNANAQSNGSVTMKSYTPESGAYNIYYPENYTVVEKEGIVSFLNTSSGLTITITSYSANKSIEEKKLIAVLNGFIKDYYSKELNSSDWSVYQSNFDNLIETNFKNNDTYWIWWGISQKNHAVFISADKNSVITKEEIKLIRFMIENLIIY